MRHNQESISFRSTLRFVTYPFFLGVKLTVVEVSDSQIEGALQTYQHITSPPRTAAGAFSAQKMGTVDAFDPMPIPSKIRVMNSCHQFCVKAEPITLRQQNMAEKKMVPRRPK